MQLRCQYCSLHVLACVELLDNMQNTVYGEVSKQCTVPLLYVPPVVFTLEHVTVQC